MITPISLSCPGSALTFIGGIIFISLTVSVLLTRSIGIVDAIWATDVIVALSGIDVRSNGIVADIRATEDVDAAVNLMMIVSLRICRYLPIV